MNTESSDRNKKRAARKAKKNAKKMQFYREANEESEEEEEHENVPEEEFLKNSIQDIKKSKKKKKKGNPGEATQAESESLVLAKAEYKQAAQAVTAAKLAISMEGAKAFELYANLLSKEAGPAWEKIMKAQMTTSPWEDIYGVTHDETPVKTWDSFMECIMFHLQLVLKNDVGRCCSIIL